MKHAAVAQIREAYRFQWSLAGPRAFLSRGSHLMLRGEADVAMPHRVHEDALSRGAATAEVDQHRAAGDAARVTEVRGEGVAKCRLLGLQLSAYARETLARLVSRVRITFGSRDRIEGCATMSRARPSGGGCRGCRGEIISAAFKCPLPSRTELVFVRRRSITSGE